MICRDRIELRLGDGSGVAEQIDRDAARRILAAERIEVVGRVDRLLQTLADDVPARIGELVEVLKIGRDVPTPRADIALQAGDDAIEVRFDLVAPAGARPLLDEGTVDRQIAAERRSEEHKSELQSLMRNSFAGL